MATGRTDTELKTFLEGSKDQYDAFIRDNGADGVLFFDKDNHAVYAQDKCIIKSDVASVELVAPTGSTEKTIIKITYLNGKSAQIDTAIPDEFVRFKVSQNLSDEYKGIARTNIGAEAADATILKQADVVNNLTTNSTTAPLSAAQGIELKRQIDDKVTAETGKGLSTNDFTNELKSKLDGIDDNAQTNREVTVNGNPIGRDNEENQSTIRISGNLVDAPNNGEDSKIEFNLSHQYYPTENKIRFFKTATPPATYDETLHSSDVVLTIDTTDFVLAGMITDVKYIPEDEWLEITFPIINQTTGERENKVVEVSLSALIDSYLAGAGLLLDSKTKTFSTNLGDGLKFDSSNPKKITLKLDNKSGLEVSTDGLAINVGHGLAVDSNDALAVYIDTENGLKWTNGGKFGVDWTKAPLRTVNGETIEDGNVDTTPKVWSF